MKTGVIPDEVCERCNNLVLSDLPLGAARSSGESS
jgi:hypothetical protein